MLAALVLAAAPVLARQETPQPEAPPSDAAARALLEELIVRSRAVKSFTARLLVSPAEATPTTIRIDYVAPDAIRLDTGVDAALSSSSWCRGSVFCMCALTNERRWHARVDFAGIEAEMRPIEDALDREFPPPTPRAVARSGQIVIDASFDAAENAGNLTCSCSVMAGVESPFGWLPLLRDKAGRLAVDADHLLFKTEDGRVDFVIARTTGFLEKIVALGANGTTTVAIESLTIDGAIDPVRIELPTGAPAGEDHSESYRELLRATTWQTERENVYRRIGAALPAGPIDAAARVRIESVLIALNEVELRNQFDPFIATTKQWNDECASDLRAMHSSNDAERDAWRTNARAQLVGSIDYAGSSAAMLPLPVHAGPADHDADLLELERSIAARLFEERCRAPLLADFDQKTSAD